MCAYQWLIDNPDPFMLDVRLYTPKDDKPKYSLTVSVGARFSFDDGASRMAISSTQVSIVCPLHLPLVRRGVNVFGIASKHRLDTALEMRSVPSICDSESESRTVTAVLISLLSRLGL